MPSFSDIFIGVPQSKYSGIAILLSVLLVAAAILFGRDPLPFGQRLAVVALVILIGLPGVLLTLFQLNCLVVGAGARNQRWWCSAYAWILTLFVFVYAAILIAAAVLSLTTGAKIDDSMNAMSMATANTMAMEYFHANAPGSIPGAQPLSSLATPAVPLPTNSQYPPPTAVQPAPAEPARPATAVPTPVANQANGVEPSAPAPAPAPTTKEAFANAAPVAKPPAPAGMPPRGAGMPPAGMPPAGMQRGMREGFVSAPGSMPGFKPAPPQSANGMGPKPAVMGPPVPVAKP